MACNVKSVKNEMLEYLYQNNILYKSDGMFEPKITPHKMNEARVFANNVNMGVRLRLNDSTIPDTVVADISAGKMKMLFYNDQLKKLAEFKNKMSGKSYESSGALKYIIEVIPQERKELMKNCKW